jgi:hypothetical protein
MFQIKGEATHTHPHFYFTHYANFVYISEEISIWI